MTKRVRRTRRKEHADQRIGAWKKLYDAGVGSQACDALIKARHFSGPVPDSLLARLARTTLPDKYAVKAQSGLVGRRRVRMDALSLIELEILKLASHGWSDPHIAEALNVTVGTINDHWKIIFRLANIPTRSVMHPRSVAVARAIRLSIIK